MTPPVAPHPLLAELGRDPEDQQRLEAFARDLAAYLADEEPTLAPLARVVTTLAAPALADPRRLCRGRPLLAAEAAARWTETLWPFLRSPAAHTPAEQGASEGASATGGGGARQPGGGAGEPDNAPQPAEAGGTGEYPEEEDGSGGGEDRTTERSSPTRATAAAPGQERQRAEEEAAQEEDSTGAEEPTDAASPALQRALQGLQATGELDQAAHRATVGAVEAATARRTLERYLPGIGWSLAPGELDRRLLGDLPRTAALLASSPALRRLADALGRVERAARRGRDEGGGEEVVGVHIGGDVRTALPSELGLLGDGETEDLFYQRLTERRLVSLELAGAGLGGRGSAERRGPVIACIDTSGSMEGAPEAAAKALVLAICRRVLPQRRTVHLLLFGGPDERTELRVRPGPTGLESLLDFLALGFRAGTDLNGPLRRAAELLEESALRKADLLIVTDGLCRASRPARAPLERARAEEGLRIWTLVLGNLAPRSLVELSDQLWRADPEQPEQLAEPLRRIHAPPRFGRSELSDDPG